MHFLHLGGTEEHNGEKYGNENGCDADHDPSVPVGAGIRILFRRRLMKHDDLPLPSRDL
jgi:hypothetical protein